MSAQDEILRAHRRLLLVFGPVLTETRFMAIRVVPIVAPMPHELFFPLRTDSPGPRPRLEH